MDDLPILLPVIMICDQPQKSCWEYSFCIIEMLFSSFNCTFSLSFPPKILVAASVITDLPEFWKLINFSALHSYRHGMEFLFSAFALMSSSFADVKGKQHFSIKRICDNRTAVLQCKCVVVALPVCCICTVWYAGLQQYITRNKN